ncbi:transcription termination factor NusA [Leptospirillum ferrooxidans]|jgi:N utilization substance protein A|uniref:transcription termination factor NusA n=1 Tax=Leptospirillum ferrooxidans TaxID=180 RepID=UPI0002D90608|nr:transcription termination factor NusA [Leptospirillum ferrooxidans]
MVNQELLSVLDQLQREKGITQETLVSALEAALVAAARKRYGGGDNYQVEVNHRTGEIQVLQTKRIVEHVESPAEEISLEEAKASDPEAEIGDEIGSYLEIDDFGRIAAQAAKQVVFQKVREAEWNVVTREFGGRQGDIINGVVIGHERKNYIVDLGKTEAILPFREQMPRESFRRGDRIKCLLLDLRTTSRGPQIILSRTHPDFVARLFEKEVPEISEGVIEIRNVVREPGERAKFAVFSKDPNVDPVGSCVGVKGVRVQAVVRELHGEKVDIIEWSPDPATFISRALSPAKIQKVAFRELGGEKVATVIVADQQLSLSIGRRGHNVRLAAKLTGWKIDIFSDSQVTGDSELAQSIDPGRLLRNNAESSDSTPKLLEIEDLPGMGGIVAEILRGAGFDTVEKIANADLASVSSLPKFGPKTAAKLIETARDFLGLQKPEMNVHDTEE